LKKGVKRGQQAGLETGFEAFVAKGLNGRAIRDVGLNTKTEELAKREVVSAWNSA
jgi:hypothetical protein